MDGFDVFYPDRMASRILTWVTLKTLIERMFQALSMKKQLVKWLENDENNFTFG